jgi:phosphatidylglycerophosphate synthase
MLDSAIRRKIDPFLDLGGQALAGLGVGANSVTVAGFLLGLGAAFLICIDCPPVWVLLAFAASRLCDGLDGAVAKVRGRTDLGGFLDIVLDFSFYGAIPLAFAFRDPSANALPAAALLLSFYVNGTTFLAFAAIAARRGIEHASYGAKSLLFSAGLAEATETIAVFVLMILWPDAFAPLALAFAVVCFVSAGARIALAVRTFR